MSGFSLSFERAIIAEAHVSWPLRGTYEYLAARVVLNIAEIGLRVLMRR